MPAPRFALLVACVTTLCSLALTARRAAAQTEDVFRLYSDRVVKIEVQEVGSAAKASIGSGFFVGERGLVLTNFHVVAELVHRPDAYRARLGLGDGDADSPLEVLNVDVVHDLALVRTELPNATFLLLAAEDPPQGMRLYALGHPLDLGLNIVEGTYNGFLQHARDERIHFTGSLNPGMSGGPAMTRDGAVVGVNVATAGEQVSFLVPVVWARKLIEETMAPEFEPPDSMLARVREQMLAHQSSFVADLVSREPPSVTLGGIGLPTKPARFFNCWADAYREDGLAYQTVDHQCSSDDYFFVSDELVSGRLWFYHRLLTSEELSRFQFAALYTDQFQATYHGMEGGEREVTPFRCHTDTLRERGLTFKTSFCLRGYRSLEGLYDLVFKAAVLGRPKEGLETALTASGVSYESATSLVRWYLGSIAWAE